MDFLEYCNSAHFSRSDQCRKWGQKGLSRKALNRKARNIRAHGSVGSELDVAYLVRMGLVPQTIVTYELDDVYHTSYESFQDDDSKGSPEQKVSLTL